MTIYHATKTLALIDAAIEADQGASYRKHLGESIKDVGDAYDSKPPGFRSHFGISTSGRECSRALWYSWRWVKMPRFEGRILRLFNRGHLEEARFVAMIRAAGMTLYQADANGNQFRVSYVGGHYGSAIDGVIVGCPDLPDPSEPILSEFKTHNAKSFAKLVSSGLYESKKEHYVQMIQYMGFYKLRIGLYLAVNKDTDELYGELIEYDRGWDEYYVSRSATIILARFAPPRISDNPSVFACRFCDFKKECHYSAPVLERNCRTCVNGVAQADGTWVCAGTGEILDKAAQLKGCESWTLHPDLQ